MPAHDLGFLRSSVSALLAAFNFPLARKRNPANGSATILVFNFWIDFFRRDLRSLAANKTARCGSGLKTCAVIPDYSLFYILQQPFGSEKGQVGDWS
jgi:hypothetical protein